MPKYALRVSRAVTWLTVYRPLEVPEASEIQISQNFDAQKLILLQIRKVDPMKYIWLEGYRNPITCASSLPRT